MIKEPLYDPETGILLNPLPGCNTIQELREQCRLADEVLEEIIMEEKEEMAKRLIAKVVHDMELVEDAKEILAIHHEGRGPADVNDLAESLQKMIELLEKSYESEKRLILQVAKLEKEKELYVPISIF